MRYLFVLIAVLFFAFLVVETESKLWPWLEGESSEDGGNDAHDAQDGGDFEGSDEGDSEGDSHGEEDEEEGGDPTESFPGVVDLTDSNFDSTITSDKFVLVEFYAPWCGACKQTAPLYKKFASQWKNSNLILAKINVDKESKTANRFNINGIPTFYLFQKNVDKFIEFQENPDDASLRAFIKQHAKLE